jgi:hypothetical protein
MESAIKESIQKLDLNFLDHLRGINKTITKRSNIIISILLIAFFFFIYYTWYLGWIVSIVISLIVLGISYNILHSLFIQSHEEAYDKEYSTNVINKLLNDIDLKVNWTSKDKLTKSEINTCKLFPSTFTKIQMGRIINGSHNNQPYIFTQLEIKSRSQKRDTLIFNGFYYRFDLDFDFDEFLILDVVEDRSFGVDFFQKINLARPSLVKFENEIFEKKYAVYSNNTEFASSILSQAFIEALLKLNDILETTIYFSIRMGSLHIAMPNKLEKLFQIDSNRDISEMAFDHIKEIYNINNIVTQICPLFIAHLEDHLEVK